MATFARQQDFFETTSTASISDSDTSITLTSEPTSISDTQKIVLVLEPSVSSKREIVEGTKSGTTISSLTRGAGSTTAAAHDSGVVVRVSPTAYLHNLMAAELETPTSTGTTSATFTVDSDSDAIILDTTGLTADRTVTFNDADTIVVGEANTQTLTAKTLTSPVLNTAVSGTAVLDEDNMASNSATQLATQQSIKAYADSVAVGGLGTATTSVAGTVKISSTDADPVCALETDVIFISQIFS